MQGLNPVVSRIELRSYPGWTVRRYKDGMFDVTNGLAVSPGFTTFCQCVLHVREQES